VNSNSRFRYQVLVAIATQNLGGMGQAPVADGAAAP